MDRRETGKAFPSTHALSFVWHTGKPHFLIPLQPGEVPGLCPAQYDVYCSIQWNATSGLVPKASGAIITCHHMQTTAVEGAQALGGDRIADRRNLVSRIHTSLKLM